MNENQQQLLLDSPQASTLPSPKLIEEDLLLDEGQQNFTTTNHTCILPQNLPKSISESWCAPSHWGNQTVFLWQDESDQQENIGPIFTLNKLQLETRDQPLKPVSSNFAYHGLMNKLEKALELIQQKQKFKLCSLNGSVKGIRSLENKPQKIAKTHRSVKEEAFEIENRRFRCTNYSDIRKSITDPNQEEKLIIKVKPEGNSIQYNANKVISQEDEQQNPILKTKRQGEKPRTKEEFLASMMNWSEQKKIKQLQRIQKEQIQSMAGVTFTPEINAKSKQLMKKKGALLPIYERQIRPKCLQHDHITPRHSIKCKK